MSPNQAIEKSQFLRAWDVLFLGPFLMYLGVQNKKLPAWGRAGLVISGILTITYNGRNYLINAGKLKLPAPMQGGCGINAAAVRLRKGPGAI